MVYHHVDDRDSGGSPLNLEYKGEREIGTG